MGPPPLPRLPAAHQVGLEPVELSRFDSVALLEERPGFPDEGAHRVVLALIPVEAEQELHPTARVWVLEPHHDVHDLAVPRVDGDVVGLVQARQHLAQEQTLGRIVEDLDSTVLEHGDHLAVEPELLVGHVAVDLREAGGGVVEGVEPRDVVFGPGAS